MDNIISIKGVRKKMKLPPKAYKMYNFFMGMPHQLTKEEVAEIKKIADKEHKKFILFLDKAKTA